MRSVERILRILRGFTPREPQHGLTAIAARAGLDLGTTRRILLALADEGVVAYDPATRLYRLDLGVLELASAVTEGSDLRSLAQPVVERIARETGSTSFFGIHRGGEALCLNRAEGNAVVLLRWWTLGGRMPLHCGAAPKTLLANLPEAESERILARPLAALTPRSVTDPAALRRELVRIRKQGHAVAVDDVVPGVTSLAVPVLGRTRQLLGALAITGLTAQFGTAARRRHLDVLQARAEQLGSSA
ncbi:IclR family transcriptional regulator [Falsiroseomonas oryzae]|uniref:IclR family transcriptional regulator n=1 Tax=Falsiroseomonas oryzae TaxID=2766473 RepID=UPI0022EA3FEE|nr:IclR family transcriptional regulator [Roseomonas sp. MO-31]